MATNFGAWLRERLEELRGRGVSQSDLAEIIGVDRQTVSSWKLGRTVPRRAQRLRVERVVEETLRGNEGRGDGPSKVAEEGIPYGDDSALVRLSPDELRIVRIYRLLVSQTEESA